MITFIIIAITVVVSILGFSNTNIISKFQFNAVKVLREDEYHRLVSHAFIHANWPHLIINMLVLYIFGRHVETYFRIFFNEKETIFFILLYLGGVLFSNVYALIKHRNNYYYNAVGASGAVSSILFAYIFFDPWRELLFMGIIPMPGIIFAFGYLVYSYFMAKNKKDNVAHDAHFLGALFGFILPVILEPRLLQIFIDKLFFII